MEKKSVSIRDGLLTTPYLTAGSGPPLVYLHSHLGLRWLDLLEQLSASFTVYAPVLPGFDESEGLEHLDDVVDMGLFVLDFIDALGLERPVLVGHSFGGMVAAEAASLCSPCVSRVVLIAPLGLWRDDAPVADFFTMRGSGLAPLIWHDVESEAATSFSRPPETEAERAEQMINQAQSLAAAGKYLWPIPDKGLKKRIHRLTAPALVLWGASDKLAPSALAEEFGSKLKDGRVQIIENASHMLPVEQPAAVAGAILDFARAAAAAAR